MNQTKEKKQRKENMDKKLLDKFDSLQRKVLELGGPKIFGKQLGHDEKLGQVKGHRAEQIRLMAETKELDREIGMMIDGLNSLRNEVEDVSLSLTNSFETEYDCDMLYKGRKYWAKFIRKSEHWDNENAKESWKTEYDGCIAYFKLLTKGLDTHNFMLGWHADGSAAVFHFTVSGVPGDFEILLPLNSSEYFVQDDSLKKSTNPSMSMSLAWRRRWVIPNYDYFFDGFGAYTAEEVNAKLHEFIFSSKKYEEFCNVKTYAEKRTDWKSFQEVTEIHEYNTLTQKRLESLLREEIEKNSKEGKCLTK